MSQHERTTHDHDHPSRNHHHGLLVADNRTGATMTFLDYIAKRLGTRKWFVAARWCEKTRDKYDVRISQAEFTKIKQEYEAWPR